MDVVEGYKDTKIGRIPKDWEVVKLSEVADILNNKRKPLNSSQRNSISGDVPYYGANGQVDSINDFIFNEPLILMAEDGGNFSEYEYKHIAYKITGKSWVNNHAHVLKPKSDFDFDYIFYELEHKNILRFINGSTRTKLNQGDLKGIPLKIPPLPEQQKIAEILSTVDEQISTTQAIIDKSKELKKGLMQKLFSEGIGHTEFKDTKIGRIPKDWEVVRLDSVSSKIGDGLHSTPKCTDESEYYFVNGNNLIKGRIKIQPNTKKVSEEEYVKHKKELSTSTILMSINGTIGNLAFYNMENVVLGKSAAYINLNESAVNKMFFYYFLQTRKIKLFYLKELTGTTIANLSLKSIRKTPTVIPSMKEQQKIADILSEADAKIEKEEQEKAKLEELKKGLMQQLLTGKKRVKA